MVDIALNAGPDLHISVTTGSPITFTSTQANTLIVIYTANAAVSNITASGLTFTRRGTGPVWTAPAASIQTAKSITVTSGGTAAVLISAFTGVNLTTPWDANGALPFDGNSTPSITTTSSVTLALAYYIVDSTTVGANGFSTLYSSSNFMQISKVLHAPASGLSASVGGGTGTIYAAYGDALVAASQAVPAGSGALLL